MLTNRIDVAPVGLGLGMDLRIPVHLEEKERKLRTELGTRHKCRDNGRCICCGNLLLIPRAYNFPFFPGDKSPGYCCRMSRRQKIVEDAQLSRYRTHN